MVIELSLVLCAVALVVGCGAQGGDTSAGGAAGSGATGGTGTAGSSTAGDGTGGTGASAGGTGGTSTGGTTSQACNPNQVMCNGQCAHLETDSANCGACGAACQNGTNCVQGACVAPFCTGTLGYPGMPAPAGTKAYAVADFDGDGLLDVAALATKSIVVSLNEGNHVFGPPATYAADGVVEMGAADFDGDGKADVAAATGTAVLVLLNDGSGALLAPTMFGNGTGAKSIATSDLDGDGKQDLILGSSQSGLVYTMKGAGDGTFGAAAPLAVGTAVTDVAAADLTGDGKPDIAAAHGTGIISVLVNNGNGTFAPATSYDFATPATSVRIGDVDGDDKPDLVIASALHFYAALGNGNGTFGAPVESFGQTGGFDVADVDGDGLADAIAFPLHVYPSLGNGSFLFNAAPEMSDDPGDFGLVADLDGDGDVDILAERGESDAIDVLWNDGAGTFDNELPLTYQVKNRPSAVALGDMNDDGFPDVVLPDDTDDVVSVLLNGGDGTLGAPQEYGGFMGHPLDAAIGDLDKDGNQDVVVVTDDEPGFVIFHGAGGGLLGPSEILSAWDFGPDRLSLLDFNGDGLLDMAAYEHLALSDGAGGYTTLDLEFPGGVDRPAYGDVNGDGHPDVVGTGGNVVWLGHGDGTFDDAISNDVVYGAVIEQLLLADIDGDGADDAVAMLQAFSPGQSPGVGVALATGGGHFLQPITTAVLGNPTAMTIADMNGDGRPDVLVTVESHGALVVLLNDGAGGFSPGYRYRIGPLPKGVAAADMNGDTGIDMVVSHYGVSDTLDVGLASCQ